MTEGNEAHVHHLVVYMCSGLNDSHVGNGHDCENGNVAVQVQQCRGGTYLAAWAVGGEVSGLSIDESYLAHNQYYCSVEAARKPFC